MDHPFSRECTEKPRTIAHLTAVKVQPQLSQQQSQAFAATPLMDLESASVLRTKLTLQDVLVLEQANVPMVIQQIVLPTAGQWSPVAQRC